MLACKLDTNITLLNIVVVNLDALSTVYIDTTGTFLSVVCAVRT